MASNRHLGRIIALQTLYEYEFRVDSGDETVALDEVLSRNLDRYSEAIEDKSFVEKLTKGVQGAVSKLDALIQPIAPEWPIEQISRIDRTILRMAVFELTQMQDLVPPKVAINEAVELAKAFGSENSSKFVNGVLGTAYRTLVEGKKADASTSS
ncbi:MAG TPA: transcription antitermination factor NusB [Candidatus Saccharimonadales bacterium]|nr:transcription antitermination factor NusB [Candidatus Saccharimonadales bacterium]